MTQEIIEGNKLIAEFMNQQGHSCKDAYAENWNALMPVVEKIESLDTGYKFQICRKRATIIEDSMTQLHVGTTKEDSKIKSVFVACCNFITWHNSLTPSSGR
jgi:hypothetical protein